MTYTSEKDLAKYRDLTWSTYDPNDSSHPKIKGGFLKVFETKPNEIINSQERIRYKNRGCNFNPPHRSSNDPAYTITMTGRNREQQINEKQTFLEEKDEKLSLSRRIMNRIKDIFRK